MYLTFDAGTTALKTALVSPDGQLLAVHDAEYTPASPHPGWMEMQPDAYWQAMVVGTHAVFAATGREPSDIRAIGFSSQGETFIPLDADRRPLHPFLVWLDNRAQAIAERWETDWLNRDHYRAITGYPWVPGELTLFKIAWLREHLPEVHAAATFAFLPDYLIWRLTGELVTDHNIAQMSGICDVRGGAWSPELLDAAGITAGQLPPIRQPGSLAGQVHADAAAQLGIAAGVPVCLGCNDQLAGAIGAGNVRPGPVTEATGTALAVVATTDELLDDRHMWVGRHAQPEAWYAMPFAPVSGIVLTWFRDLAGAADFAELLAEADSIPAGSDGLTVLPHFAGTAAPTFNPEARGAIIGLTLGHTRAHIARAIMESCACMLRELIDPIRAHGITVNSVRSLGGAARSDLWLQMKADMLGVPVDRPVCSDAASLGAAMLAATGTGQFASVAEAADAWYRAARTFEPDPANAAASEDIYGRYLALYDQLYGAEATD